jgi:hypothetical protein
VNARIDSARKLNSGILVEPESTGPAEFLAHRASAIERPRQKPMFGDFASEEEIQGTFQKRSLKKL